MPKLSLGIGSSALVIHKLKIAKLNNYDNIQINWLSCCIYSFEAASLSKNHFNSPSGETNPAGSLTEF